MASFEPFYPHVEPYAPGVTVPAMQQALREAAIEFCERTNVYQELTITGVAAGDPVVFLDVPTGCVTAALMKAMFRGKEIQVEPTADVAVPAAFGVGDVTLGDPTCAFLETPDSEEVRLYPVPVATESNVLVLRAAYAPSRTAMTLPDVLAQRWVPALAAGALERLKTMPDRPFSDAAGAARERARFETFVSRAANIATRGRTITSRRVVLRGFV